MQRLGFPLFEKKVIVELELYVCPAQNQLGLE
jgi:hypothetical protein